MGANNLSYSSAALEALTENSESRRLTAYDDARPDYILQPGDKIIGTLTIGWGHTGRDVYIGLTITDEEADTLLMCDTMRAQICVNTYVDVVLTQNQFDALVDFVFNVGTANFISSTLLKDLNAGKYKVAELQLSAWVFSGGKKLPGLIHRRALEENWFAEAP